MSTKNFSIRAYEANGAFSDRDFAINIRNTSMERMVAVSDNHAYSSRDGVNWTLRQGMGGRCVAYGNGRWVIGGAFTSTASIGRTSTSIMVSTDAVNWKSITLPTISSASTTQVFYCGEYWIATYLAGSSARCAVTKTPEDESSWVLGASFGTNKACTRVIFDGTRYIFCIMNTSSGSGNVALMATTDFSGFSSTTIPGVTIGTFVSTSNVRNDISYVGGNYIYSNGAARTLRVSKDLINWTLLTIPTETGYNHWNFAYGNGALVMSLAKTTTSGIARCLYSYDAGMTWAMASFDSFPATPVSSSANQSSVAFVAGQFLMGFFCTSGQPSEGHFKSAILPDAWSDLATPMIPPSESASIFGIAGIDPR